jgi:hypothetical protein
LALAMPSHALQVKDHVTVNHMQTNASTLLFSLPESSTTIPTLPSGSVCYDKNLTSTGGWWAGNATFNATRASIVVAGTSDATLQFSFQDCPDDGCDSLGPPAKTGD